MLFKLVATYLLSFYQASAILTLPVSCTPILVNLLAHLSFCVGLLVANISTAHPQCIKHLLLMH